MKDGVAGSSIRSTAPGTTRAAIPVWATLIALEEDGVVTLGVVSAPALHRRWWAERGGGAFAERRPRPGLRDPARSRTRCSASPSSSRFRRSRPGLARTGLRRLLEPHARRRGRDRRRHRRGRRHRVGPRRRSSRSSRRPAECSPTSAGRAESTAGAQSRPTGTCTRRCSKQWPRNAAQPTTWRHWSAYCTVAIASTRPATSAAAIAACRSRAPSR